MNAAQTAHDMREYIEKHGWIQGREEDPHTRAVCLIGALYSVTHERIPVLRANHAFLRAFTAKTGTMYVVRWNDAPERTYEDVILLLKQIETEES